MSWHIAGGPRYPFETPPDCITLEHDDLGDEVRYHPERECRIVYGPTLQANGWATNDLVERCGACNGRINRDPWTGALPRFCPDCGARVMEP